MIFERSAGFSLDLHERAGAIGDWSTFGPHQEDLSRNSCVNQSKFVFRSSEMLSCLHLPKDPVVQRLDCPDRSSRAEVSDRSGLNEALCHEAHRIAIESKRPGTR